MYRRPPKNKYGKQIEQKLILNSEQLIFNLFYDGLHTFSHRSQKVTVCVGTESFSITEDDVLFKKVLKQVILRLKSILSRYSTVSYNSQFLP